MEKSESDLIKAELHDAIKHDQLVLYFQPQFNLLTEKFEAAEVLVRWHHPQRGFLLPDAFIPHVAENELIVRLGEWVLKAACDQIKAWHKKKLPLSRVSVNVFERQLRHVNFVEQIMKVLKQTHVSPDHLEIELTENIIIHDDRKAIHLIERLKTLGVHIALDDFGTGYSSISYLKKMPVDRIKIDQSFIKTLGQSEEDAVIVGAIISIASSLHLRVMAEGVETFEQLKVLLSLKCHEAQGNYFSEPLPAHELERFILMYQDRPFM